MTAIPKTNYSARKTEKTGIVMHWMVSEQPPDGLAIFKKSGSQVSAHYGISSDGTVLQYVEEDQIAYHAGVGRYNLSHIGIEHAGGQLINGERKKPTQECHDASARLVAELCKRHNIPIDRKHIIKHSEVKDTQCCGTLDIDYIILAAKSLMSSPLSYELYAQENNVMLRLLGGEYNGDYIVTRKDAGDRTGSTFGGTLYTSKSRADRKIIAGYDPITYEVNVGGVVRTISFLPKIEPVAPAVEQPSQQEIQKLTDQLNQLRTEYQKYNETIEAQHTQIQVDVTTIGELKSTINELKIKNNKLNTDIQALRVIAQDHDEYIQSIWYSIYKIFKK